MPTLRLRAGPHDLLLEPATTLVVGRDRGADVVLDDARVSRRHLLVHSDGLRWYVEDTSSSNGTFAGGSRVGQMTVDQPVRLLLGDPVSGLALDLYPDGASVPGPSPRPAPASQLRLTVLGLERTLSEHECLVLGRGGDAAVQVDDPRISRRHLALRHTAEGWLVEDLGGANGTWRDAQRVSRLLVDGPTTLRLGDPRSGVPLHLEAAGAVSGRAVAHTAAKPPASASAEAASQRRPGPVWSGGIALGSLTVVHHPQARSVIGRSSDADIVVDDLLVSRRHAELRSTGLGTFLVADLGSHNGTFLNGRRLQEPAPIAEGDVLRVGGHSFRLHGGGLEEFVDRGDLDFSAMGLKVLTSSGKVLLEDCSFALGGGGFLAVVGVSGAGKSTLLNALTGFRPAQEGSVTYGGRDLYACYDEMRTRIGYVPQDDILHPQLTVRRALEFAAELRFPPDVPRADRMARVGEVMAELGLTERADLPIGSLSGGQRKRTSIALELLTKPSLLFLDEPTSGLDPGYEKSLMRLLRDLADGGRTVVVVTHSLQSLSLCDRVIFMAPGGRTAFFGPPDQALSYFRREDFADVFSDLEQQRGVDWRERFLASPAYQTYVAAPLNAHGDRSVTGPVPAQQPPPRHRWARQLSTLTRRYLAVILSDRVNLAILLAQAPILGVIILLAIPPDGFVAGAANLAGAQEAALFLTISMTYLGAGNAIREIVKEAAVYRRERSVGLSISAYVASKVLVLSAVTVLQAVVLVLIGTIRQGSPASASVLGSVRVEIVAGMALAGLASMSLGLLVSSVVKSGDKALTLLPLLLVPQLVLSFPQLQADTKPVLAQLTWLSSASWGFSDLASSISLNQDYPPADTSASGDGAASGRARWRHGAAWAADAAAQGALIVVTLGLAALLLKRRDPPVLGATARSPG